LTDGVNIDTIANGNDVVTLVNVFIVAPGRQEQLAGLLVQATEKTIKHLRVPLGQYSQELRWHRGLSTMHSGGAGRISCL